MPLYLNGTDGVYGVNGTNTTPANRGSDTNTGIVYGTDTVQIATGGTTAVSVDSSQNVGIGTASPATYGKFAVAGQAAFGVDNSDYFVTAGGSGTGRIEVAGSNTNINMAISTKGTGSMYFWRGGYGGTASMLIDGSGNVMIGQTTQTNNGRVDIYNSTNGNGFVSKVSNNAYSNFQGFNAAGSSTFGVTGAGALTKASGTFKIDHPLPALTDTHHLVHSFIEGPQADLIYRGVVQLVDGKASVNIDEASDMTDGTFVLLCREVQCFTSNETNWDAVRGKVTGNILTIESQNSASTASVSWLVIGERQDKHIMETDWTDANGKVIVEPLKAIVGEAK